MIRTFTTNTFTAFTAVLPTAAGIYFGRTSKSSDPFMSLVKLTSQIAGPLIGYITAFKVQNALKTETGAIFSGMATGLLMAMEPESAIKLASAMIILTGGIPCLCKTLQNWCDFYDKRRIILANQKKVG